MLKFEEARKIGLNACIDRLGRGFVMQNKNNATSAFGENDGSVFCFVGVDTDSTVCKSNRGIVLDGVSKFPYRVSCNVGLSDGVPVFVESIVPNRT